MNWMINRQKECKTTAFPQAAFDADGFLVQFKDALGNGQAEASRSCPTSLSFIPLIKAIKDKRQILCGDAATGIADTDSDVPIVRIERQPDRSASGCVAHGVIYEIFDDPLNHGDVGVYQR